MHSLVIITIIALVSISNAFHHKQLHPHRSNKQVSPQIIYEDLVKKQSSRMPVKATFDVPDVSTSYQVPGYPEVTDNFISSAFYGTSYLYFPDLKLKWFAAYIYCRQHGLQLTTLNSREEFDFVVKFLSYATGKTGNSGPESIAWIGATDLYKEGNYTNMYSGRPFITFYNAPRGVPNNHCEREHCAEISLDRDEFHVNDMRCGKKINVVCTHDVSLGSCQCVS